MNSPPRAEVCINVCTARYGLPVWLVRAPGRVNLIGEHTDYNSGFVLPFALEREIRMAIRPRADRLVSLYSLQYGADVEFSIDDEDPPPGEGWPGYVWGMSRQLIGSGALLGGFEGVVDGDLPRASGLSSSAALSCAAGLAFATVSGIEPDLLALAKMAQQTEHEVFGLRVGIMDPFASLLCKEDHALLIDCRSHESEQIPVELNDHEFVIIDSRNDRSLAGGAYNRRRASCEAAADVLKQRNSAMTSLRDASIEELEGARGSMDSVTYRRARHVITENARVLQAVAALKRGDVVEMGRLMNESHASLRDDYEVSSEPLDLLTEIARTTPGCHGSRLTGAGFGGCTVSLMRAGVLGDLQLRVEQAYQRPFEIFATRPAPGASVILLA